MDWTRKLAHAFFPRNRPVVQRKLGLVFLGPNLGYYWLTNPGTKFLAWSGNLGYIRTVFLVQIVLLSKIGTTLLSIEIRKGVENKKEYK